MRRIGLRAIAIASAIGTTVLAIPVTIIAAEDVMAPYYNGTLKRMDAVSESRTWYNEDGTMARFSYELTGPEGSFTVTGVEGAWRLEGGPGTYRMCEKLELNIPESCNDFQPRKIGDRWDAYKQGVGGAERWELVEGRTTRGSN